MKRYFGYIIAALLMMLILFATSLAFAQQKFEGSFLSFGVSFAPSLITPYNIMFNLSYLNYGGSWFGLGFGLDGLYNLSYNDFYLIAYARLAIRRLYFEIGASYNIIPSNVNNMIIFEDSKILPYLGIRLDLIMFERDKQAFNINLLLGMIWTSIPAAIVETDNFISSFIASIIASGVGMFINSIKIGIGFTYTFSIM